jgi:hypothetical protein
MYKTAWICGDSYAEIIFDGDTPVDLEILSSDNVRQVIRRGKIVRFEEINGDAKWRPYQILHLPYMKRGAMTHGNSMVSVMNNVLLEYLQMHQLGDMIYKNLSKPREIVYANTDSQAKLDIIRNAFKAAGESFSAPIVLPKGLIDEYKDVQLNAPLKPGEWLDVLRNEIFLGTATPALLLGIGYSTSADDALTRLAGFRGSIRYEQKWMEELIRKQLFEQMYPDDPPEIEFSYATEAQDERYNRNLQALPILQNLAQGNVVAPENVQAMIEETFEQMGLIT